MGSADSISFPKTEADVVESIRAAGVCGTTVTTQGARTGIVAGAVPQGGHVLNLSRMNSIGDISHNASDDSWLIRIEKVIFESRSKIYVTCNLYVPNGITSPRGAVLFASGHADTAKASMP